VPSVGRQRAALTEVDDKTTSGLFNADNDRAGSEHRDASSSTQVPVAFASHSK
jgi:hypothetical protein